MNTHISFKHTILINDVKPYIGIDHIRKKSLEFAKAKINTFLFFHPIICNKNNEIVMGITHYYAAKELGMPEIEIVYLPTTYNNMEKYFQYLDYIVSNSPNIIKQLSMIQSMNEMFSFNYSTINVKKMGNGFLPKLCNLIPKPSAHIQNEFYFFSLFETNNAGFSLEEIKSDCSMVNIFCDNLCHTLIDLIGINFSNNDWCICTTPRRRHKDGFHFASAVCEETSKVLGIPFYYDIVTTNNRSRINPVFSLQKDPLEPNIILFDDILTTGITLRETRKLLLNNEHTIIPVVGIWNKHISSNLLKSS